MPVLRACSMCRVRVPAYGMCQALCVKYLFHVCRRVTKPTLEDMTTAARDGERACTCEMRCLDSVRRAVGDMRR